MRQDESTNSRCPLCGSTSPLWMRDQETRAIRAGRVRARRYFRCGRCALVHVAVEDRVSNEVERMRYLAHNNDRSDYREHLETFADRSFNNRGDGAARVLDYGSGPTPVLADILESRGYEVSSWDPFFAPDRNALSGRYDTIVLHEVIEHIAEPEKTIEELSLLLAPNGRLAIRTQPYPSNPMEFARWWYRSDSTHLAFYRHETFEWIAAAWAYSVERRGTDLWMLRAGRM